MLRIEVGARGAHQVKNMRGYGWTGAVSLESRLNFRLGGLKTIDAKKKI